MSTTFFPDEKIKIKTRNFGDNYLLKKQFKYVKNVKNIRNLLLRKVYLSTHI